VFTSLSTIPFKHMSEWRYSSTKLDLGTWWKWAVRFTRGKIPPQQPCTGGLCGPQSWSGPCGTEKNLLSLNRVTVHCLRSLDPPPSTVLRIARPGVPFFSVNLFAWWGLSCDLFPLLFPSLPWLLQQVGNRFGLFPGGRPAAWMFWFPLSKIGFVISF
jgi:hypothetical protein